LKSLSKALKLKTELTETTLTQQLMSTSNIAYQKSHCICRSLTAIITKVAEEVLDQESLNTRKAINQSQVNKKSQAQSNSKALKLKTECKKKKTLEQTLLLIIITE